VIRRHGVHGTIVAIKSTQRIMEPFYSCIDIKYDTLNRRVKEWNDMLKARDPRLAGFAELSVAEAAHRFCHGQGPPGPPLHARSPANYDPSKFRSSARCASVSRSSPASASSTYRCERKPYSAASQRSARTL